MKGVRDVCKWVRQRNLHHYVVWLRGGFLLCPRERKHPGAFGGVQSREKGRKQGFEERESSEGRGKLAYEDWVVRYWESDFLEWAQEEEAAGQVASSPLVGRSSQKVQEFKVNFGHATDSKPTWAALATVSAPHFPKNFKIEFKNPQIHSDFEIYELIST